MIYTVIGQLQKEAILVQQSCRVVAVSRPGFTRRSDVLPNRFFAKASVHSRAAFMASHQSYGSRRLVTAMASDGFHIGSYIKIVIADAVVRISAGTATALLQLVLRSLLT